MNVFKTYNTSSMFVMFFIPVLSFLILLFYKNLKLINPRILCSKIKSEFQTKKNKILYRE